MFVYILVGFVLIAVRSSVCGSKYYKRKRKWETKLKTGKRTAVGVLKKSGNEKTTKRLKLWITITNVFIGKNTDFFWKKNSKKIFKEMYPKEKKESKWIWAAKIDFCVAFFVWIWMEMEMEEN